MTLQPYIPKAACVSLADDPLVHLVREVQLPRQRLQLPWNLPLQLLWALGHEHVQFWGEGHCLLQITCVYQDYRCERQTWLTSSPCGFQLVLFLLYFTISLSLPLLALWLNSNVRPIHSIYKGKLHLEIPSPTPANRVRFNPVLPSIVATSHCMTIHIKTD